MRLVKESYWMYVSNGPIILILVWPGKRDWVTGHQELELALVKLYKVTKNEKYLKLADWLLSERGKKLAKGYTWTDWKDTAYAQDVIAGERTNANYRSCGSCNVYVYGRCGCGCTNR